jgi:hypothetical protein
LLQFFAVVKLEKKISQMKVAKVEQDEISSSVSGSPGKREILFFNNVQNRDLQRSKKLCSNTDTKFKVIGSKFRVSVKNTKSFTL